MLLINGSWRFYDSLSIGFIENQHDIHLKINYLTVWGTNSSPIHPNN